MGESKLSEIMGHLLLGPVPPPPPVPQVGETAAIYIHFPFCSHICTYCDFDTFAGQEGWMQPYIDALVEQIRRSPEVQATSLYFGGGTPSLASPDQSARIVEACRDRFNLPIEVETTIEANPSGLSPERLRGLREAGFNRLSLGVQSTDARLLKFLGRRHRAEEILAAIEGARYAGFSNVSVDLLYGVPGQEIATWETTLKTILGWGVEHLSCYALTIESGTPLERGVLRGTIQVPPDDRVVAMYQAAHSLLVSAGFHRYEISNWARPGLESGHNLTYWRNRAYLGIGAGAAGCWRGRRYKIAPNIAGFIQGVRGGRVPLVEDEEIEQHRAMSDTLMLGLRLDEGVSAEEFAARHGVAPEQHFGEALAWAEGWGLAERVGGRLKLTEQGVLLSNELFARLL